MNYPRVSVVIPVYNEEVFIERCITSLLKQTVPPDEIIIVDNNSTDKTAAIVRRFPVKIVTEHTQGITFSRNRGFDAAGFEIIARCDADSYAPGNWVQKIKSVFSSQNIDALTGPIIYYDLPSVMKAFVRLYAESMKIALRGNDVLMGPNMCITSKLWRQIRAAVCTDNTKVHEDIDLTIHIVHAHGSILRDNQLIMYSSARRIVKNPLSFFIEYPIKIYSTFTNHHKLNT